MMKGGDRLMKRVKSADVGILWDLDGTLIDSVDMHVAAFAEAMKEAGYTVSEREKELYRAHIGKPFVDIIRAIYPDLSEEEIHRLHEIKAKKSIEFIYLVKPVERAVSVLKETSRKAKNALVTSSMRTFTDAILKHFGWADLFDVVITADDVKKGKPDPEPLLTAVRLLGTERNIYVGDTDIDRQAARAAGIPFIHVDDVEEVLAFV